jgi:hypothetical protein
MADNTLSETLSVITLSVITVILFALVLGIRVIIERLDAILEVLKHAK